MSTCIPINTITPVQSPNAQQACSSNDHQTETTHAMGYQPSAPNQNSQCAAHAPSATPNRSADRYQLVTASDHSPPPTSACPGATGQRIQLPPPDALRVIPPSRANYHELSNRTSHRTPPPSTGDGYRGYAPPAARRSTGDRHAPFYDVQTSTGDAAPGTVHTTQLHDHTVPTFMQNIAYPFTDAELAQTSPIGDYCEVDDTIVDDYHTGDVRPGDGGRYFRSWPFPAPFLQHELAMVYDAARTTRGPNHIAPRILMPTDLNLREWEATATGHHDDPWIIDAVKYGFPIQYSGPPMFQPSSIYNHTSAAGYRATIQEYIQKETGMGALHGPYPSPPFVPWFHISPMMTRQKPDSNDRRVIVDLSYPDGGVNAFIEPHVFNGRPANHNLPTIESAVQAIASTCPGDIHLSVIDLSRAYRQFPVPPTDWPMLGIQFDGMYYFDGRLPFGARLSSFAMQSVAHFILRALRVKGIVAFMYLDDILMVSAGRDQAQKQFDTTLSTLCLLGLQVAEHKLQPPSREVTWLGVKFDLNRNELSIPQDKLAVIKQCLAATAKRTSITRKHLQSVLGYINHLAKVVRPARIFISRMLAALRAAQGDTITVTKHVKADLAWFCRFLDKENARTIIPHSRTVLRIWADSSLKGGGATDGERCYAHSYPSDTSDTHHITQLEAVNVLAAARAFVSPAHAGGHVEIYSDNMSSVSVYTSGRARDPILAACCRAMWYHAAQTQTMLVFTHVPGEDMVLPDALSRASFDPRLSALADAIIEREGISRISLPKAKFSYTAFM